MKRFLDSGDGMPHDSFAAFKEMKEQELRSDLEGFAWDIVAAFSPFISGLEYIVFYIAQAAGEYLEQKFTDADFSVKLLNEAWDAMENAEGNIKLGIINRARELAVQHMQEIKPVVERCLEIRGQVGEAFA